MLSREQADALANLIHLLRPEWDRAGIFTALGHCKQRNELDVAMAAIRAAASSEIRTPGAIPANGDHWHERVSPQIAPRPPKPHEACRDCGRHFDACLCDGGPTISPHLPAPDPSAKVARLKAIRDEVAGGCCSHHVDRRFCVDHRKTTPEESA